MNILDSGVYWKEQLYGINGTSLAPKLHLCQVSVASALNDCLTNVGNEKSLTFVSSSMLKLSELEFPSLVVAICTSKPVKFQVGDTTEVIVQPSGVTRGSSIEYGGSVSSEMICPGNEMELASQLMTEPPPSDGEVVQLSAKLMLPVAVMLTLSGGRLECYSMRQKPVLTADPGQHHHNTRSGSV